jgi:hypothetical protein
MTAEAVGAAVLHLGDCVAVLATLDACSVDAVVTDPPYGLEFMGKDWDAPWKGDTRQPGDETFHKSGAGPFDRATVRHGGSSAYGADARPMRAFQAWCEAWARECLRVLKPGGHLLSFGGSRTYHRMASAIEDAGFEIRDQIMWIYGSGFPKSLDVSKAIDKQNGRRFDDRYALGRHIRERREACGISRATVNKWFNYSDGCEHWERQDAAGARVPSLVDWAILRERLALSDEWSALVEREAAEREIIGKGASGETAIWSAAGGMGDFDVTAPATDAAKQWDGWGTALKPAHEPIVVARKPLSGTVAANVLAHGTGALNIDGCRIPTTDDTGNNVTASVAVVGYEGGFRTVRTGGDAGRWPANVILSYPDDEYGLRSDVTPEQKRELFGWLGANA